MKICITGKPCSGKTLAINYLKEAKYNTWIADQFVNSIYKSNAIGYKLISKYFGNNFLLKDKVNKKALGQLVFSNDNALKQLNKLMNPLIKDAIKKLDKSKDWFVELGTYIYYSNFFKKMFEKIILIYRDDFLKKNAQIKKFLYIKKIPTFFVDNYKKQRATILHIGKSFCKTDLINVDIFVDNSANKQNLKKNILKICSKLI